MRTMRTTTGHPAPGAGPATRTRRRGERRDAGRRPRAAGGKGDPGGRPVPRDAMRPGTGTGFGVGAGFAGVALVSAVAAHLPYPAALAAYVVFTASCAWWTRPPAAWAVAGMSWLFLNGFVVHSHGVLGWSTGPDLLRLGVLAAAAAAPPLVCRARAGALRLRARLLPGGAHGRAPVAGTGRPAGPVAPRR